MGVSCFYVWADWAVEPYFAVAAVFYWSPGSPLPGRQGNDLFLPCVDKTAQSVDRGVPFLVWQTFRIRTKKDGSSSYIEELAGKAYLTVSGVGRPKVTACCTAWQKESCLVVARDHWETGQCVTPLPR